MSTLYQQRDTWYLNLSVHNKRIRKSLRTNHLSVAKKLAKELELEVIKNILVGNKPIKASITPIKILIKQFLAADHGWSQSTYSIYREKLRYYLKNGLPDNATSRSMVIRCVNRMNRWAYENNLIPEINRLDGGSRWEHRLRTFNDDELKLILNDVKPNHFQLFVCFAYYTGARRGEICALTEDNIREELVSGKSGKRKIKLNSQARFILDGLDELWDYRPPYISQAFKKNLRRLNIKNGRFHDLRRTFGLNLIKQGMPIYEVSKLLGHSSVRTTEKHYAPLLVTDIADFKL